MYRRITVEEVKAAYAVTGAKPTRGTYLNDAGSGCCAHGALALAAIGANIHKDSPSWGTLRLALVSVEAKHYGTGDSRYFDYINAFTIGFDGGELHNGIDSDLGSFDCMDHEHCLIGYADGRAAWEAMKHEL